MKVSVALCTYNGEKYLAQQLDSILGQTLPPDELVISDDGSADRTLQIVEEFRSRAPFPVRLFRNPERLNYTENFIACISRCEGDAIALCDQDDVWLPTRLQAACEILAQQGEVNLVVAPAMCTDDDLRPSGTVVPDLRPHGMVQHQSLGLWFRPPGLSLAFRAAPVLRFLKLERVLSVWGKGPAPFDEWIAFLASIQGKTVVLPRYLVLYRRHAAVTTGDPRRTDSLRYAAELARKPDYLYIAAQTYSHLAAVAAARAEMIAQLMPAADPAAQAHMSALSQFYTRVAETQHARVELYAAPSRLGRLKRWGSLLGNGDYGSRSRGGLGLKSLAKDGLMLLR